MAADFPNEHTIRVGDLIAALQTLHKDDVVVMSKDAEGNQYSPFSGIGIGKYLADRTWCGEFADDESLAELTEDDWFGNIRAEGVRAVCLWPVN